MIYTIAEHCYSINHFAQIQKVIILSMKRQYSVQLTYLFKILSTKSKMNHCKMTAVSCIRLYCILLYYITLYGIILYCKLTSSMEWLMDKNPHVVNGSHVEQSQSTRRPQCAASYFGWQVTGPELSAHARGANYHNPSLPEYIPLQPMKAPGITAGSGQR